jgi:hypothetical protein
MRIVSAGDLEWRVVSKHRQGDQVFKTLLSGEPSELDNFELSLVRSGVDAAFYSPRHRHNFDQIRYSLEGTISYGPKDCIRPGQVAYFPEGTYYGPQDEHGYCVALVYQGGGPSGAGFLSYDQIGEGSRELAQLGTFENGAYRGKDRSGATISKDSYEAIWEHIRGRPMEYPEPRYDRPVMMYPEGFHWLEVADGVARRNLGTFNERGLGLGFVRLTNDGSLRLTGPNRLLFVLDGELVVNGTAVPSRTAIRADASDDVVVASPSVATLIEIERPRFDLSVATEPTARSVAPIG